MIIYKKLPFDCQMKNIILLDDHIANGCVYVDVNTYNQALSLMLTYSKDFDRIFDADAGTDADWKTKKEWKDRIKKAWDGMPEPLNALAPYLGHLSSVDNLSWSDDPEVFAEQVYGYLHVMSTTVDFFHTTTLKPEMRQTIMLPKHLLEGYAKAWDLLTQGLDKTVVMVEESRHDVTTELSSAVNALKEIVMQLKDIKSAPVVTPIAAPVVTPITSPAPVEDNPPVTPTSNIEVKTAESSKVEESTEDEDDDDDMDAFFKEMQAKWAAEDEEEAKKQEEKEKEKEKIMTEEIRREKEIAEQSLATMNSYDI